MARFRSRPCVTHTALNLVLHTLLMSCGFECKKSLLRRHSDFDDAIAVAGAQVPLLQPAGDETPIRLLISAFQDGARCAHTLFAALNQSSNPGRLYFNVLQAVGPGDVNCLEDFKNNKLVQFCSHGDSSARAACIKDVPARVNYWKIPLDEGMGPVHQRGLLSDLVADIPIEDGSMCLSTDSHMDFTEKWDADALEDWSHANNEFAVMSSYPPSNLSPQDEGKRSSINLCGYFLSEGIPRGMTGAHEDARKKPQLTMNWAAGSSFARCHAERNVPVDKNLRFIFNGEEAGRAVRFWTSGYDLYNPGVNVVLHNYSHAKQDFWEHAAKARGGLEADKEISRKRIQQLLKHDEKTSSDLGRFGLGSQRTIEQFVRWSHTNLGGRWGSFLEKEHIDALTGLKDVQSGQPLSPSFCESLVRVPVRDADSLRASVA